MKKPESQKGTQLRLGVLVLVGLAMLTAAEYWVGVSSLPQALLWIFILIKAGIVLWFFMHIRRLFDPEGGH